LPDDGKRTCRRGWTGTDGRRGVFVAIIHPDSGEPMFRIGKESGRYVLRGRRGSRLSEGCTFGALSASRGGEMPYLRLI